MVVPITFGSACHDNRDAGYPLVLRSPKREKTVGVMRRYPIAQKAGWSGDYRLPVIHSLHAHRSQPAPVGGFADLRLEMT